MRYLAVADEIGKEEECGDSSDEDSILRAVQHKKSLRKNLRRMASLNPNLVSHDKLVANSIITDSQESGDLHH